MKWNLSFLFRFDSECSCFTNERTGDVKRRSSNPVIERHGISAIEVGKRQRKELYIYHHMMSGPVEKWTSARSYLAQHGLASGKGGHMIRSLLLQAKRATIKDAHGTTLGGSAGDSTELLLFIFTQVNT